MKKRGFGTGKLNGVGGKVLENEEVPDSLIREIREEIGVEAEACNLEKAAIIFFSFKDKPEWAQTCSIFFLRHWGGDPVETEEMKLEWIKMDQIPYEKMWVDDSLWRPLVLKGKKIRASFHFDQSGEAILDKEIAEVEEF